MIITVNVNLNAAPELLKAISVLDSLLSANLANTQICAAVAQLPVEEVNPAVSITQAPVIPVNVETAQVNPTFAPAVTPVNGTPQSAPLPMDTLAPAPTFAPPAGQMAPVIPVEELRAKAQEKGKTAGKEAVKALLGRYESKSLSSIPEADRAAFMAELEAL